MAKEKKVIKSKPPVKEVPVKVVPKEKVIAPPRTSSAPELLRGMRDILPAEQKYWRFLRKTAEDFAVAYGFDCIETPIMEPTNLFVRAVGKQTDIVEKEMYSFDDQGGERVTLRPEATASIVRAYLSHGMFNIPQPVKLWYEGPMFRYERPQAGRSREFHQVGFEILGEAKPAVDAELIIVGNAFLRALGVAASVQVNSIGHAGCREPFKAALLQHYRARRSEICEDCKRRLTRNPLRVLDCKIPECQPVKNSAPQIVDHLCDDCRTHFMKVLEILDEADVPYVLTPHLVRGLDYYGRTVFEYVPVGGEEGAQSALGAGGRYDGLADILGGRATPAAGFSFGMERIIARMREANAPVPELPAPSIFLAQLGEHARRKAFALFEKLRAAGIRSAANFSKESLKQQMEIAGKLGVRYALILGQKEVLEGTLIIRDMDSGVQEIVGYEKAIEELRRKLG